MWRLGAYLAVWVLPAVAISSAAAQDMPLVRSLVERALVQELAQHDSEESAWYDEKSVDKQKYTSGKLLGRKIRVASWTEQSKTWFWLDEPQQTLSLQLERLAVVDARLEFAVSALAQARFNVWGRIPKLVRASVSGTARLRFEIEGSTAIAGGGLSDSRITRFKARLDDLHFNSDFGHPFEDLVKDALNDYIKDKNKKLRASAKKALNRVRF
jgi:hypothetical protein